MTPRERFLALLKHDILKLDLAELNFGVYRILNARRDLVLRFLDEELPAFITDQLATLAGTATEDEEGRIYAALDTFFHRYWDDGDFVLRPRRGRDAAYSIPYDGSDVHFHWATKGSHYVKSGEFLKTYAFKPEDAGGEVRFEVATAQQEKDNVKGAKRYFVPGGKAQDGATAVFRFEYRPLTEAETKKHDTKGGKTKSNGAENGNGDGNGNGGGGQLAASKVQDHLLRAWLDGSDFKSAAVPAALRGAAFDKHVARYVRRQTTDFFVHPHLGPFLEGELDYFLKNEFLQLWDRETAEALARERAKFSIVREIGKRIIAFLHQIEDFQARLFEKRKFILRTDWLVINGTQTLAYRVEVEAANQVTVELLKLARKHVGGLLTEDQFRELEAQVARIVGLNDLAELIEALLQQGRHAMPDDDLARPLPRLWCEEHLYRPLLLSNPGIEQNGQLSLLDQELGLRLDPPGLEESEARFVWDLRAYWKAHSETAEWRDCSIYLLRNQARRGVGFFAEQGFYPDFMLWLKRGKQQALAFVEPKGIELLLGDARLDAKLDLLQELNELTLDVPTRGFLVSATPFSAIEAREPGVSRESLRARGILMQGEDLRDVQTILGDLRTALNAV